VGHHVPAPRDEIEEAIAGYGVAASQLVQTTSKAAIPIDVRIQSAREVIDSVERHKPKQEKPQTVKIAKNKLKKVDKRP
jgi:antitoxin component of RelBE/YafQ-DinJ toxin-antitoxin module